MNIADKLDLAIKLHETGSEAGAYAVAHKGGVLHKAAYMTNGEWQAFLAAMKPSARCEYGAGGGDELSEKDGRPPKMASYGSSSRLIYRLSCQRDGFHYEKKLPTTVGGQANLDGFYEAGDYYWLVEAKCREPYTKKSAAVSTCYDKLYEYINRAMAGQLQIKAVPSKCGRYLNVEFWVGEQVLQHFDLKQMICHLLGIATGVLRGSLDRTKELRFLYLLYDPRALPLSPAAREEIVAVYEKTCRECRSLDFAALFRAILEFLRGTAFAGTMTESELHETVSRFTFTLVSQREYAVILSHPAG